MRNKSERSNPPPKTARSHRTAVEKAKTTGRQAPVSESVAVPAPAKTAKPQSVKGGLKQDTSVRSPRVGADAALLEAKNNLDAIFNAITEAVFLMDTSGTVISANTELARRLNCRVEDIVGKPILDFLPAEVADSRRRYAEEVISTGRAVKFEDTRRGRHISVTIYPVLDSRGSVIRLAVYSQDVTDQRHAEDALRESEKKYRRIVEAAGEGIWALDAHCLTTYVNQCLAEMLGYAPEEMIGKQVHAFMFAEDIEKHSAQAESRRKGEAGMYERRFRCRDGRELWAIVSAAAIKDTGGNFAGSFAMLTDITARKRAEEEQIIFEQMVTSSTDAIVMLGLDYTYRAVNDTYLRWVGLTREQMLGRMVPDVLGQEFFNVVIKPHLDCCMKGEAVAYADWFNYPAAGRRFVEVTQSPCRDHSNAVIGAVVVGRDRTGSKQAEFQRDASARALQSSEALLRATMSSIAEGILVVDDAGKVLLASPHIQELWRIPAGLMAEGSDEKLLAHVRDQLIDPDGFLDKVNRIYSSNEETFDTVLFKDGRVFERFSMPLLQEGRRIGRTWSFRDITKRRKAERSLSESQIKLRLIYTHMPDALLLADTETGIVLDANPAATVLLDRPLNQIIGLHFSQLHPPVEFESAVTDFNEHASSDITSTAKRHHILRPDGSQVPVEVTGAAFILQGKPVLQGIFRDISVRERHEEALKFTQKKLRNLYRRLQAAREEERRRVAREIHDELGQYLTVMKIDLAWLRNRLAPDQNPLRKKLSEMDDIVAQTLQTVQRVAAELRPGILDSLGLAAAVEWYVKDFEKRTEIQCGALRIEPEDIQTDPALATDVFRILQEALTNIARHARATQVQVTLIRTRAGLHLKVTDNGIGISAGQASRSTAFGILGMQERVDALGGELSVHGISGGGTCVSVHIPLPESTV